MLDFTLKTYKSLLEAFRTAGYSFFTFEEYCDGARAERMVVLRHDVDLRPGNSLRTAELEHELGIKATYYFRAVPESLDQEVLLRIAELEHEIGYHYESLTTCGGDVEAAYTDFCANLAMIRLLAPVRTICMHGSPRSPYDSKDIWKRYSYKGLGLVGEPYMDTDFMDMFYLTDTGRCWDGFKVSVRDKIPERQDDWVCEGLVYHSTSDLIAAIDGLQSQPAAVSAQDRAPSQASQSRPFSGPAQERALHPLPPHLMMTTHPQRWTSAFIPWLKELVMQNLKNVVKKGLAK